MKPLLIISLILLAKITIILAKPATLTPNDVDQFYNVIANLTAEVFPSYNEVQIECQVDSYKSDKLDKTFERKGWKINEKTGQFPDEIVKDVKDYLKENKDWLCGLTKMWRILILVSILCLALIVKFCASGVLYCLTLPCRLGYGAI
ncbi:hypothetical protein PVAND_015700 [Polypedilum vanderplanki]|uniref:Uncharacterized protein n=1 Tax=Polypedilum vanderplanki TaxID=319348 RepID=A0A9J6BCX3_POLVA|nr:hypothetical protein PVAND_015700 [Polypedilum vanderplanki]